MERLLIVRLGAMGDVLHALPVAAALRHAFPQAVIGWAIEERWAELLCARDADRTAPRSPLKPLVDVIHPVNTRAWRAAPFSDETWQEAVVSLRDLRAMQYEAALDVQGLLKSAAIAQWSDAPRRIGFARPKERAAALFYTTAVESRGKHVIEWNLALASAVTGDKTAAARFELPQDPAVERWRDDELRRRGVKDLVMLSPGAGWGAKLWPAERYGEVARALADDGLQSLVNHGPGEETLARQVVDASGGAAQAIACSLGELAALLRRARLVVASDSGPMHLAAALKVPVVALFGPTDPERNGPYGTRSVVLRSPESRTSYAHRGSADAGLLSITAEQVVAGARELLRGSRG
jgi:heptosyltransferase-1